MFIILYIYNICYKYTIYNMNTNTKYEYIKWVIIMSYYSILKKTEL